MRDDKDSRRRALQMRVGIVGVLVGLTLLARSLVDPAGESLTWLWIQMVVTVVGLLSIVIQQAGSRLVASKVLARSQPSEAEDEFSSLR
ncbi:MAG: hypothetical protein ACRD0K_22540 [Egibacteraceae bacterium]